MVLKIFLFHPVAGTTDSVEMGSYPCHKPRVGASDLAMSMSVLFCGCQAAVCTGFRAIYSHPHIVFVRQFSKWQFHDHSSINHMCLGLSQTKHTYLSVKSMVSSVALSGNHWCGRAGEDYERVVSQKSDGQMAWWPKTWCLFSGGFRMF